MAAPMAKFGQVLVRSSNCVLQSTLFRDTLATSRILTCHQQIRERRRTSKPAVWHVRKKTIRRDISLTDDNKMFLKKLAIQEAKNLSSPLKEEPWPRGEWNPRTRRTGVLAIKIGVMPQWTKDGDKIMVTLLQVLDNHVVRYTPPEEFEKTSGFKPWWKRFGTVAVGALSCPPHLFAKEYNNLFKEAGILPKRKLTRFIVTPEAAIQPGTPLTAMHFRVGDYVDCQAKTVGHGFQGVVKRWGFKGGPKSHGNTKWERRPGAIGQQGHSRVMKGKKMPGHMGVDWKIQKGVKIWRINTKYNILYVSGGNIPGPKLCYVRVYDTVISKKRCVDPPPMPTFYDEDAKEPIQEEYFDKDIFQFTSPSVEYQDDGK